MISVHRDLHSFCFFVKVEVKKQNNAFSASKSPMFRTSTIIALQCIANPFSTSSMRNGTELVPRTIQSYKDCLVDFILSTFGDESKKLKAFLERKKPKNCIKGCSNLVYEQ